MSEQIAGDSLITLHYRLVGDNGLTWVSTFEHGPATLQLGCGELAPPLERHLIGLQSGDERSFELAPSDAFGPRIPQLVQRVARADLPPGVVAEAAATITIDGGSGRQIAGIVHSVDADSVLIDFNHPLAGRGIRFDVRIIGTL